MSETLHHGAEAREAAVEAALSKLDLDTKARLISGQDFWSLPELPEIGLGSLVMSDGPIGVRGVRWTADDPSIALPSPTALAASWDPELARRAGVLLAQEARRKGVHVLLAPTVNLHRSPLGGRHFECYSEDPYLTGEIGTGYIRGVQSGGVGTTVKHFVGNDAETDRFTVNNIIAPRPLRELYLAPFEAIVANAHPWGIMTAYNTVNGTTMSEHRYLVNEVLRGAWHFDGANVSDWTAARSTVGDITGGLDVAMPGPRTPYGPPLAAAVRAGEVDEADVDAAVRNVLRLAARVGILEGADPVVPASDLPAQVDGDALAREVARRSFTLVRNEAETLPLNPTTLRSLALIGAAARDARILGGGSATVFPNHVISPLDGLTEALGEGVVTYAIGADPSGELAAAEKGFALRAICRDAQGEVLGEGSVPGGQVKWVGSDLPDGVTHEALHTVEVTGTFTPRETGEHTFGTQGLGGFEVTVAGHTLFTGMERPADVSDPFAAVFGGAVERGRVTLKAGEPVPVTLTNTVYKESGSRLQAIGFTLMHRDPQRDADELIAEAVATASAAEVAVVVVATTEAVESEGHDRTDLRLPGRQDELVRAVVAANPNTVVVVNAGSPVELPWRDEVAAVLLSWFPGQGGGAALADVLLGTEEPGGRLPTTWPAVFEDAPVTEVIPTDGELPYTEGVFIGYRAWDRTGVQPAYGFGHGLGYTTWRYESVEATPTTAKVRVSNTGGRRGREVVQVYVAPTADTVERPARWLAGFASVEAGPGESAEVEIALPRRAFEIWDEGEGAWSLVGGEYEIRVAHALQDVRLTTTVNV
ncbi:beta-glucosidase family protein [Streptomyces sp. NBC_01465]|uniref:beta-glucosidase family protein n=1 Tax=Streptomyces sp. NBC_01465 TaxID=2903878 RepID=UPI002E2FFAE8|nr:glycoside hydrolase family 3 C-terminal domain-containing protein [Streptomyces sp. NBC_01465]